MLFFLHPSWIYTVLPVFMETCIWGLLFTPSPNRTLKGQRERDCGKTLPWVSASSEQDLRWWGEGRGGSGVGEKYELNRCAGARGWSSRGLGGCISTCDLQKGETRKGCLCHSAFPLVEKTWEEVEAAA